MESLKLQTDIRNALYFGKYSYRARWKVHGASYTYYTKSLEEFTIKMAKRAANPPSHIEVVLSDWRTKIDQIDYDQIGRYFSILKSSTISVTSFIESEETKNSTLPRVTLQGVI